MRRWVVFFLIFFPLFSAAAATTYYVDPAGNDTNTGLLGSPFREIRKALTVVTAGDTVLVSDGQYLGFDVSNIQGTAASPITIKATGSGAIVNITTDRPDNRDTIFITNASTYVIIDGLHSFNANRAAVRIDQCAHITVRNGVFGNNATWGIFTDFSDNLLLESNECYSSGTQHGIYVSNTCTAPTVRGNLLHDNYANGLHMNGDVSQGGAGIITNALVENNIIYSNGTGGGSGINCDGVQSSLFRNNLIYNALGAGISLYQTDASQPSINNVVVNNTIDVGTSGKWCLQIHSGSTGTTVFNNIFLTRSINARGSIHFDGPTNLTGLVSDYNILTTNAHCVTPDNDTSFYTFAQWQAQGFDAHSISATEAAVFANQAGNDYHLVSGGPGVDAGAATLNGKNAPTTDNANAIRPFGNGYDIGAFEFGSTPGSGGGGGGGGGTVGGGGATPPAINSPPSASSSPITVNVPVTFSAGATDASGGTVTYAWNFGDGTTANGASVTHTYTSAGSFTVTVTITGSNGGVTSATLPVTVVPNSIPMTISKLQGAANFKLSGKDSCSFSGILPNLPTTFSPAGKTLTLNVDGVSVAFTLDAHGRGKTAQGSVALKLKTKRNKATKTLQFVGGDVPFMAKIQKGSWAAVWNFDPNSTVASSALSFPITLALDGNTYAATAPVTYSAKAHTAAKFKK